MICSGHTIAYDMAEASYVKFPLKKSKFCRPFAELDLQDRVIVMGRFMNARIEHRRIGPDAAVFCWSVMPIRCGPCT